MGARTVQRWTWRRWARLLAIAVIVTVGVALYVAGPVWFGVAFDNLIPLKMRRSVAGYFLKSLLFAYFAALGVLISTVAWAMHRTRQARKLGQRRPRWVARVLAGGFLYLLTLGVLEGGSALYAARTREIPEPPVAPPPRPGEELAPPELEKLRKAGDNSIYLVVLGESSARGEPYHTWLSMGQILGWELEKVFPGREIKVDIRAAGGAPLKPNHRILFQELTRRPDAVLIYSGHNEFQSRFRWSRPISYYADDVILRPRAAILNYLGRLTPLCRLIHNTIELHEISIPPPKKVTNELIDRPICSAAEYAQVLDEFRRRLESMTAYCERLGATPILVIPAGNDVDFEPSRSSLAPATLATERKIFATELDAARAMEGSDPKRAIDLYRRLLDRQPSFAEAHFRLARLLDAGGDRQVAIEHYVKARDLDGLPLRCPSGFQEVYREVAARHSAILVDGQAVLGSLSQSGLPDGHVLHDVQHPSLASYVALSQVALDQLAARRAFDWPKGVPAPLIDPDACAERAGMNAERWGQVCARAAHFFEMLAYTRYDPSDRLRLMYQWRRAESVVESGANPAKAMMPGLGTHPPGVSALDRDRFRSRAAAAPGGETTASRTLNR
jgi:tetratricopeptide (TPR) repeat protein